MKKSSPQSLGSRRLWRKAVVVLSALTFGLSGCSPSASEPHASGQGLGIHQIAGATFSIKASDFYASSTTRNRGVSAASVEAQAAFSFADVAKIKIDVKDKLTDTPIYLNYDLTISAGEWTGQLPFLPKDKALTFAARAFNASGTLLFQGKTDQTLTLGEQTIVITLAAANDGQSFPIPRIKRVSVPSALGSDQVGNVSFSVEATTGETLTYEITSPADSGTFYPPTGTITLLGTAGTFVSQYVPPSVTSASEYEHTVKVTNESGNSVVTTFKTRVKPPGSTEGVADTKLQVYFNPVINSVTTSRQTGTGNVLFQAEVADDGAASELTYTWSFKPAAGTSFSPAPVFSGATNPATLTNYTTAVQGTISLEVKDGHGGKTTLFYPLPTNQFPDNPVAEGGLTGLNSIGAGGAHTCVLFNNGNIRCWGYNGWGQLGYENTLTIGDNEKPYTAGDVNLVGVGAKLTVGGSHTCALLNSGLVRCWGRNNYGQLGYGTTDNVGDGEAIASYGYVNLGGIAVQLAAGSEHTCALMNNGKVRCWGRNNLGQLGTGEFGDAYNVGDNEQPFESELVDLGEGVKAKDITAGGAHTCALLETGGVRCWGYNGYGQLGYGNTKNISDPSSVADVVVGGPVKQLSAGKNHTCALLNTGYARCWGYNGWGQLGYGHNTNVYAPTSTSPAAGDVPTGGKVLQVTAGDVHTCALMGNGDIKCWGNGDNGRLGYGSTTTLYSPPAKGVDLDDSSAFRVEAGSNHTCALLVTGAARCWGYNGYGQLGYGNTNSIGDSSSASAGGDIQILAP